MSTPTFKGHGTQALFLNFGLACTPAFFIFLMLFKSSLGEQLSNIEYYLILFSLVTNYGHPCYLFFEIKHLITKDGIAEDGSLESKLVFGGLSLLGLIFQVFIIVGIFKLNLLGVNNFWQVILLSFVAAFGGCLGLTDLHVIEIIFPRRVVKHALQVITSRRLVIVCLSTTVLLSLLTYLFI